MDQYTADAMALANVFNCTNEDIAVPQQRPDLVNWDGTQWCNWYVPYFDNPYYGGIMTILRCATYLKRVGGISQRFLICDTGDPQEISNKIGKSFPELADAEIYMVNCIEAIENIPPSDFSIATLWTTAYTLLKVRNTGLKFYFIQDYEPLFYPAGSTSAQVDLTYHFGFYGIANTISLREIYEKKYGGLSVHFTPSVDSQVFYPPQPDPRSEKDQIKVFFYGRPGHPRNAFEIAAVALRLLKNAYGDRVRILCAGAPWSSDEYGLSDVIENLGLLSYEEAADLYRNCHIGFTMMMTKHPSYIPFELMASGTLVVTNHNPANYWFLKNRVNCLLSHPSASCLAGTLSEAINKYNEMLTLRAYAASNIAEKYSNWNREMERVLCFIQSFRDT